ncbi:MAG: hypothetical protein OT477_18410 [Chloroflexi bacterium]|nr:hypothetical protein [Chloroflexota bacterium]
MEKETFQLSEQLAEEERRNGRVRAVAMPLITFLLIILLNFLPPYLGLSTAVLIAIAITTIAMIPLFMVLVRKSTAEQIASLAQFHVILTEQGIERHNKGTAEFFPYTAIRQLVVYRQRNGAISYLSVKANRVWTFWRLHDLKRLATLLEERVPQQATRQSKRVYVDWQHPLAFISLALAAALLAIFFIAFVQEPSALNLLASVYMVGYGVYSLVQRPLSRVWGSSMRWREDFHAALGLIFISLALFQVSTTVDYDHTHPCHPWNRYVGQSSCVAVFKAHESVAFLPDQHTLVIGNFRAISFQPIPNRLFYRPPVLRPQGLFSEFAMTPDGQRLVSNSWDNATHDNLLELWDLSTYTLLHEEAIRFNYIEAMHLHPNQPIIALSVGWLSEARLLSTADWQPISPITHTVVAFSPDGTLLATRGQGESAAVQLWQLADWTPNQTLRLAEGRQPYISQAVFSQDGQWLAAKGSDNLHLWHLASGENLFNWFTGVNLTAPAFSPTQPILAVGQEIVQDQHEIALWSLTDGVLLATIPLGEQRPSSLSFSSDGALLAVGTYSKAMVFQMDKVLP